jgi:hypothetical protein
MTGQGIGKQDQSKRLLKVTITEQAYFGQKPFSFPPKLAGHKKRKMGRKPNDTNTEGLAKGYGGSF